MRSFLLKSFSCSIAQRNNRLNPPAEMPSIKGRTIFESDCCDVATLFFQMNFSLMGSFWVFENRKRENPYGDEFV